MKEPAITTLNRKRDAAIRGVVTGRGLRNLKKEFEAFSEEQEYVKSNFEKLLRKYRYKWVAIAGRKVIAHAGHLEALLDDLEGKKLRTDFIVEYLTDKPPTMLL